jgi:hypothetical protein
MPKKNVLNDWVLPSKFEDRKNVPLVDLTTDYSFYPRKTVNQDKIDEYTKLVKKGHEFPPIDVINVDGILKVYDGFMRFSAYQSANRTTINCRVVKGTKQDALRFAANSNLGRKKDQGLPRNKDDVEKIVRSFLCDDILGSAPSKLISDWAHANPQVIARMRPPASVRALSRGKPGGSSPNLPASSPVGVTDDEGLDADLIKKQLSLEVTDIVEPSKSVDVKVRYSTYVVLEVIFKKTPGRWETLGDLVEDLAIHKLKTME